MKETLDICEKYIKEYDWKGTLVVDGGWGRKDVVTALAEKFQSISNESMVIEPGVDIGNINQAFGINLDSNGQLLQAGYNSFQSSPIEDRHYYNIYFQGAAIDFVEKFMSSLRQSAGMEIKIIVHSFTEIPEAQTPVYQLTLVKGKSTSNLLIRKLEKGAWVPSFDKVSLVAGW